jgi:guanylate kinase
VGPSGAGKGTLIGKLTKKYPDRFGFSVSYTTRAPRKNEQDGVHYFFVDHAKFQSKIENNDFIEYCKVHTNFYGTEKAQIRDFSERKIIPILDIDI